MEKTVGGAMLKGMLIREFEYAASLMKKIRVIWKTSDIIGLVLDDSQIACFTKLSKEWDFVYDMNAGEFANFTTELESEYLVWRGACLKQIAVNEFDALRRSHSDLDRAATEEAEL